MRIYHEKLILNRFAKVSKGIGVLRRVKDVISKESLERLYKTSVLPHFDCSFVWDNCANELKPRLQNLQNKAGRVITGDSNYSSATNTLMKLG